MHNVSTPEKKIELFTKCALKMKDNFDAMTKSNEKLFFELEDTLNDEKACVDALNFFAGFSTFIKNGIIKSYGDMPDNEIYESILTGRR